MGIACKGKSEGAKEWKIGWNFVCGAAHEPWNHIQKRAKPHLRAQP